MSELTDQAYRRLFKAAPGKILVVRPHSFEIVAVTDAYLEATMTRESDIVGKTLFEVFPDDPDDERAEGTRRLLASLERVQTLKTTDIVGVLRYPVRRPDGHFEERFWSPVNSPVLNDVGDVEFIMHRAEDITAIVQEIDELSEEVLDDPRDAVAIQEIILRSQDLRQALSKLQEYEARMRTAERLLNLGAWQLNLETGQLDWSDQVFDIYNVPRSEKAPNVDAYFDAVHPDDRAPSRAIYQAFVDQRAPQIEFEHRVEAQDGSVRYVKGVGERHVTPHGEMVVGYVQDITPFVLTRYRLTQAEQLLRLAGERVRLGGWRVELDPEAIFWTPETAAIHGMPADYSPPDVSEAIQYYAPEYRQVIQDAFEKCARSGEEFDVICRLQTADGRQPWVRSIGIAERDDHGRIHAVHGAFQDITKLREAQDRADEADRQRVDVLESINDGFFMLDPNWNFVFANRQACLTLGRTREELLSRNIWEEYPDRIDSEFTRHYRQAVESRETVRFQGYLESASKWFDVAAYPLPDGLAVYFRDVTLEREHQEQLRLVDAALSRQNDVVMITEADVLDEPDGPRIVYVNEAFERMSGYSRSEAIGRTPRMLQGPETDREQLDRIREALINKVPIRCEVLNYSKSGEPYWLELDITPLFDDFGTCTHFVAVERDVTERKEQETALREAQERFQLISRATNDVIWDWDLTTNHVWWNDSITEVFGYSLSDLEPGPESWIRHIHPEDRDRVLAGIHEVIDGSEELWTEEYRYLRSDGQNVHVIDRGFVIRDGSGTAVRMVGSMLDITERMDMEQRLRESQKLETVGHLTGGVAHDFNNLLTVILGNAELLTGFLEDPKLRRMAEMTMHAAQRGAQLTSRLLAFARRKPLDPKPTDLNRLVEAIHPLVRRTLPESIELVVALDPAIGITEVDAGELDTALLNLVVNARDAMPDGGKLTIETANVELDEDYAAEHAEVESGRYVMVSVSDTGIGMDRETLKRVFEPFFTTKPVGKGSGLGLSMVFGFTKQSGGHIKVYSEPGEGTSVKLYFPMVRTGDHLVQDERQERPLHGGTEHILIAEDDELVLNHLEGQLHALGYRVSAARSGPEALHLLETVRDVDLLLTDIVMPGGMNGRELADRARAMYPSLKVLFTSGYTENAIVHHGRLDAGVDLLSKPYSRLELATKVRSVLDRKPQP